MKQEEIIQKKIKIAESRIKELIESGELKKLSPFDAEKIAQFYLGKSNNRLETAKIIFDKSKESSKYSDFSESVSAAYYSMYYIVHSFLAKKYKTKLREQVRGVHAITHCIVLYYLVKNNKLAKHLYDEYLKTLDTVTKIQNLYLDYFEKEAFNLSELYDKSRSARETFTYAVAKSAEEHHAEEIIKIAERFINVIKQLLIK